MSDSQPENFAFRLDQDMAVDDFPMDMNDPQVRQDFEQLKPDEQDRVKNLLDGILAMKGTSEYNAGRGEQNAMSVIGDFSADESPKQLGIPTGSGARGNIDERIANEEVRDARLTRHRENTAPEDNSKSTMNRIQESIQNIGPQVADAGEDIMDSGVVNGVRNFVKNSWGTPNFEPDAFPAYVERYDRLPKNRREWQLARQMERGDIALQQENEAATHQGEIDRQNTEHKIDYEYESMFLNSDRLLQHEEAALGALAAARRISGVDSMSDSSGRRVGFNPDRSADNESETEEQIRLNAMIDENTQKVIGREDARFLNPFLTSEVQATDLNANSDWQRVIERGSVEYQALAAGLEGLVEEGRFLDPEMPWDEDANPGDSVFRFIEYSDEEKDALNTRLNELAILATQGDERAKGEFLSLAQDIFRSSGRYADNVQDGVKTYDRNLDDLPHWMTAGRTVGSSSNTETLNNAQIDQELAEENRSLPNVIEGNDNEAFQRTVSSYADKASVNSSDEMSEFQLGLSALFDDLVESAESNPDVEIEPFVWGQTRADRSSSNPTGRPTGNSTYIDDERSLEEVSDFIKGASWTRRSEEKLVEAFRHFYEQMNGAN